MSAFYSLLSLVVCLLSLATAQTSPFQGDATQYTLTDPNNGNCNFMSFPAEAKTKYAALNKPQFKATANCGRCAQVWCVDAKCAGSTQSEIVHFVDQCPECLYGDLDLSPEVFKSITGHQSDRMKIQWKFVDCPVSGPVQYCLKDGSNGFWTAIQPTNFLVGIKKLQVNGQDTTMVDSAYYFLRDGQSAVQTDLSSLKITLTSISGEVIEDTVSLAGGGCVNGKSQFSKDRSADSDADFNNSNSGATTQNSSPAPTSTQAPTPSPSPSPSPTQTPSPTPSPMPTTPAPTTPAPTTATPTPSWSPAQATNHTNGTRLRGSDEVGVIDVVPKNPSPTVPTAAPVTLAPTNEAGVIRDVTTRTGGTGSTSPVLMILIVLACTCILVLVVLALMVKYRRRLERDSEIEKSDVERVSELPPVIDQEKPYEEIASPAYHVETVVL